MNRYFSTVSTPLETVQGCTSRFIERQKVQQIPSVLSFKTDTKTVETVDVVLGF
jgi:hypothetical protein